MSDTAGLFPNHPRSGFYFSEKGAMLQPHLAMPMESTSEGDSRHQAPTTSPSWDSTTIVTTGMTKGGNGANYDSDLPNH